MSFALATYQLYVQDYWFQSIEAQGKNVGVAETALGYFMIFLIVTVISWFMNRPKGEKT